MRKPFIVIEHCEKELSPWIVLEYRHSSLVYGRDFLFFTNIPPRLHKILGKYGRVFSDSVIELIERGEIPSRETIILDPLAEKRLTYSDLVSAKYIVIGGILGDHPPKGRTRELITSRLRDVRSFNIGDGQFSIDGAVYYVNYVWDNGGETGLKYIDGVTLSFGVREIRLPFRYPVVNGKPLMAEGLDHYLLTGKIPDHIWRELTDP